MHAQKSHSRVLILGQDCSQDSSWIISYNHHTHWMSKYYHLHFADEKQTEVTGWEVLEPRFTVESQTVIASLHHSGFFLNTLFIKSL